MAAASRSCDGTASGTDVRPHDVLAGPSLSCHGSGCRQVPLVSTAAFTSWRLHPKSCAQVMSHVAFSAGHRLQLGWLPRPCAAYMWLPGTARHPGLSPAGAVPCSILCSCRVSCPPPAQPPAGLQRAGSGMPLCPGPGSPHSCAGGHLGWRPQVGLHLPACLLPLWILGLCSAALHYCLPCMHTG